MIIWKAPGMPVHLNHIRRGEGEPLLLVQGLAGTNLTWGDEFLDALARDFDVIAIDNRGIGSGNRVEEPFTIADMAEDAVGALDALGIETAHLLGASMGGMIAQELVLRTPERVRTLTLGCTYAGGAGSSLTKPEVGQRLMAAWGSGDQERAIRTGWEINVSRAHAADDERYATFRERVLERRVPLALIMRQIEAVSGHDVSARLAEIDVPTLVIHGDADEMVPFQNGKLVAGAIPGARLEVFEGVGHLFWLEQTERAAELIRDHAKAAAAAG